MSQPRFGMHQAAMFLVSSTSVLSTLAFRPTLTPTRSAVVHRRAAAAVMQQEDSSPLDGILTGAKKLNAALQEGRDWKQAVAEAMAGEYDRDTVAQQVTALKDSAPLVIFQVCHLSPAPVPVALHAPLSLLPAAPCPLYC